MLDSFHDGIMAGTGAGASAWFPLWAAWTWTLVSHSLSSPGHQQGAGARSWHHGLQFTSLPPHQPGPGLCESGVGNGLLEEGRAALLKRPLEPRARNDFKTTAASRHAVRHSADRQPVQPGQRPDPEVGVLKKRQKGKVTKASSLHF